MPRSPQTPEGSPRLAGRGASMQPSANTKASAPSTRCSRGSMTRLALSLSTLRRVSRPTTTQDSLPAGGQPLPDRTSPAGLTWAGFRDGYVIPSSLPRLVLAQGTCSPTRRGLGCRSRPWVLPVVMLERLTAGSALDIPGTVKLFQPPRQSRGASQRRLAACGSSPRSTALSCAFAAARALASPITFTSPTVNRRGSPPLRRKRTTHLREFWRTRSTRRGTTVSWYSPGPSVRIDLSSSLSLIWPLHRTGDTLGTAARSGTYESQWDSLKRHSRPVSTRFK
jgi:hypothetical protein